MKSMLNDIAELALFLLLCGVGVYALICIGVYYIVAQATA